MAVDTTANSSSLRSAQLGRFSPRAAIFPATVFSGRWCGAGRLNSGTSGPLDEGGLVVYSALSVLPPLGIRQIHLRLVALQIGDFVVLKPRLHSSKMNDAECIMWNGRLYI